MASLRKSEHALTAALRRALAAAGADNVCLALSGGMDSAALLSAALPLRDMCALSACHVNHGISARAARWEDFCRALCAAAEVPLFVHREVLPAAAGEAAARAARLRAFARAPAAAVMLAHHADDQAETVLFRLLRGGGVRGMAAMRAQTDVAGKTLLRPWLAVRRAVIAAYARENRLRWIEDEDNRNLSRRRNFLRRRALPLLARAFPQGAETLAAAGRRFAGGAALLADLARLDEERARREDGGLSAAYFRAAGEERARNWLHVSLLARRCRFSEQHINEAVRQILHAGRGRDLRFDFDAAVLHRRGDAVFWRDGGAPAAVETAAAAADAPAPRV